MTTYAFKPAHQTPGRLEAASGPATELLAESEARLQALVESTTAVLWELDLDGAYTYCSPNVSLVTGYSPEELLGRTPADFMPQEDARQFIDLLQSLVVEQKPFSLLERRVRCKDGQLAIMESSGKPVFDSQGHLTGYRCVDRDVTERKRQTYQEMEKLSHQIVGYLLPWGW